MTGSATNTAPTSERYLFIFEVLELLRMERSNLYLFMEHDSAFPRAICTPFGFVWSHQAILDWDKAWNAEDKDIFLKFWNGP